MIATLRSRRSMVRPVLALLPLLFPLLAGCATASIVPGSVIHLTFNGVKGLNPGPDGTPNPVQIRVYALKSRDTFMNADYFQLADKDKDVLGSDLLFRQDVTVRPGTTQTVDATVLPGETLLGIAVAYRFIDRSTWRLAVPLAATTVFTLDADKIAIVQAK